MDTRLNFQYHDFFGYPKDVERQKQWAERVKKKQPYFAIGLPTDHVTYEQEGINPKYKNQPCLMSMVIFKIVSVTPARLKKTLFSGTVLDTYPQVVFETMDGRRMEAFELYEYKKGNGETARAYVLTRAVLKELEKNFVHPRLNISNYHHFSSEYGDPGDKTKEYFIHLPRYGRTVPEEYGHWKETAPRAGQYFDNYFQSQDERNNQSKNEEQRIKRETAAANKRYADAFSKDFGNGQQYSIHPCPKCGSNNRVPSRNKRVEISCRCGHKYIVVS